VPGRRTWVNLSDEGRPATGMQHPAAAVSKFPDFTPALMASGKASPSFYFLLPPPMSSQSQELLAVGHKSTHVKFKKPTPPRSSDHIRTRAH
jgi:hypothetical protein